VAKALDAAAKGRLDSAKGAFREGETSRLALLGARRVYYADLLQRIHASYQAQQALGQLEDALESPLSTITWPPPEIKTSPGNGEYQP
jgi:outer membrane protein TolC